MTATSQFGNLIKIGAGKRFKREALDKLYKEQSDGFPQTTTKSEFVGFACASPESFKPHIERSRRKKNMDAALCTLNRVARKKIKQETEESALHPRYQRSCKRATT
jgi:hypothetical protein